jgi:hypothetical protein
LNTFKNILLLVFILVILIFGGIAIKVLLFPVNVADKSVDLAYATTNKTMTAENAIYNYEWFKEQEAYIRQNYKNEEIAKEEYDLFVSTLPKDREKWDRQDKDEESSLRNSYYALQKLTNKAIEDYNAKSSMVNRVIFKDNLPSNIDRAFLSGKKLTK